MRSIRSHLRSLLLAAGLSTMSAALLPAAMPSSKAHAGTSSGPALEIPTCPFCGGSYEEFRQQTWANIQLGLRLVVRLLA